MTRDWETESAPGLLAVLKRWGVKCVNPEYDRVRHLLKSSSRNDHLLQSRCSKSRQALGLLKENGEEPDVIEKTKEPLGQAELEGLLKKLKVPAHDLLRVKEDEYSELGLSPDTPAEDILTAIALNPILLERRLSLKAARR